MRLQGLSEEAKSLGFLVSNRGIEVNPEKINTILEMKSPKTIKEVQRLMGKVAALNRFISWATLKYLLFFKVLRKAFDWTHECDTAF